MKMQIRATQEKVDAAMDKIREAGGTVSGGKVSIKGVEAKYFYSATSGYLTVNITDKPFLVSTGYVEGEIKKFFN